MPATKSTRTRFNRIGDTVSRAGSRDDDDDDGGDDDAEHNSLSLSLLLSSPVISRFPPFAIAKLGTEARTFIREKGGTFSSFRGLSLYDNDVINLIPREIYSG